MSSTGAVTAYAAAAPNLALIKYWGKRDSELILPLNDSISVTLDDALMHSVTMVTASPDYSADSVELNGQPAELTGRMRAVLRQLRARCRRPGGVADLPVRIVSRNSFPTAAGLASSASGLCAFTVALARLYGLIGEAADCTAADGDTQVPPEAAQQLRWLSSVARMGSGSACRSLYGGFAHWSAGTLPDGSDSVATGMAPLSHWPDLRVLVCVVASAAKPAPSTEAMERTVRTSCLMPARLAALPDRLDRLRQALASRDFSGLAEVAMRDSNSLHAVCADAFPPVAYLTDASRQLLDFAHRMNSAAGRCIVGYTADAGPNVCLLTEAPSLPRVLSCMRWAFELDRLEGISADTEWDSGGCSREDAVAEFRSHWPSSNSDREHRRRIESVLLCRLGRGALDIPEEEARTWFAATDSSCS